MTRAEEAAHAVEIWDKCVEMVTQQRDNFGAAMAAAERNHRALAVASATLVEIAAMRPSDDGIQDKVTAALSAMLATVEGRDGATANDAPQGSASPLVEIPV